MIKLKSRTLSLLLATIMLLAMLPFTAINVNAADIAISSIEVTQIMGKGIDLDSGKYYFMNMFVAGKPTAIQVVMTDITKIDSASLEIYYEGSLLTTVKPADKGERQIFSFIPSKSEVNEWKAGRYKFTVNINGESKTTEAIFNDSRTFSVLLISASVKYGGKVYDAPEIDADTIPLRTQAIPVSESKLVAKYRNAAISFGTGANGYDISTPEGHMSFLADIDKYRLKSAAKYDAVVAIVEAPLGKQTGYTDCQHAVVITLNNSPDKEELGSTLLHEIGHIFGNGDEYTGGSFSIDVNGAPYGVTGKYNGKSVTGERAYLKGVEDNDYSGILIHDVQDPYNPKAKTAMLERSSYMGSSYRHWPTSMVWEQAYKYLVPNYQNVLPRVYTDGTIIAKRPSANDLTEAEADDLKKQYRAMLNEVRVESGLAPYKEDMINTAGEKRLSEFAEEALRTRNFNELIDITSMYNSLRADTKHWFSVMKNSAILSEYKATTLESQRQFFSESPCGQDWIQDDYMFLVFVRTDNITYFTWSTVSEAYPTPDSEEEYTPQPETPPIPEINPVTDEPIDPDEYINNNGDNNTTTTTDNTNTTNNTTTTTNNGGNNNNNTNNVPNTSAGTLTKDSKLTLLAEKADLSKAPNIVLESNSSIYNLGGWKANDTVSWKFEVADPGFYEIDMEYSREQTDIDSYGTLTIYDDKNNEVYDTFYYVQPTGENKGDWSVYKNGNFNGAQVNLTPGVYYLEISPGAENNPFTDEHFINLRNVSFNYLGKMYGEYKDLDREQRVNMLACDGWDVGNPWKPWTSAGYDYLFGFYVWYANAQYGINITIDDVENAIGKVVSTFEYDGVGEHPAAYLGRFALVCSYYELYPPQEMREDCYRQSWTSDEYLWFGANPKRAKDDTDQIDPNYFKQPEDGSNWGDSNDADINDPDGEW